MTVSHPPYAPWIHPERIPPLHAGCVHLWQFPLAIEPGFWHRCWHRLSDDERARAERFQFDRDRRRFVVGRAGIRAILGHYACEAAQRLRFASSPHGKPRLAVPCATRLEFSWSRSEERALLAVAVGMTVGVDIEQVRPLTDLEGMIERVLSPREVRTLRTLSPSEHLNAFFRTWACKEAILKAVGCGLAAPLGRIDVPPAEGSRPQFVRLPGGLHETAPATESTWWVDTPQVAAGFAAALATSGRPDELACFAWSESD